MLSIRRLIMPSIISSKLRWIRLNSTGVKCDTVEMCFLSLKFISFDASNMHVKNSKCGGLIPGTVSPHVKAHFIMKRNINHFTGSAVNLSTH